MIKNDKKNNFEVGEFREWLYEHANDDGFILDSDPVWMEIIRFGAWSCLRELLCYVHQDKILWNNRDEKGRGWLHYCIYHAVPQSLAIEGMHKLNSNWNMPDIYNHTPINCMPNTNLAQNMAVKWWNESQESHDNKRLFFLKLADQSKKTKRDDLTRIWTFWGYKQLKK